MLSLLQSLSRLDEIIDAHTDMGNRIQNIDSEVMEIKELITDYNSSKFLDTWIPLELVCQKLGIGKRTFQNLRKEGKITFVQPTPKRIFVTRSEIKRFMEEHTIERLKTTNKIS